MLSAITASVSAFTCASCASQLGIRPYPSFALVHHFFHSASFPFNTMLRLSISKLFPSCFVSSNPHITPLILTISSLSPVFSAKPKLRPQPSPFPQTHRTAPLQTTTCATYLQAQRLVDSRFLASSSRVCSAGVVLDCQTAEAAEQGCMTLDIVDSSV
jgi:hypothetical protein